MNFLIMKWLHVALRSLMIFLTSSVRFVPHPSCNLLEGVNGTDNFIDMTR
jgi:hypothetical protein